jgi:SsrA-binding protein
MADSRPPRKILAENRKARHDYEILETFEAGLVLRGTEVKAARAGTLQLKDSYVEVKDGEAWLQGTHVSPYSHGNRENHPTERPRKLLLHRREIDKLFGRTLQKGLTVVPLAVYLEGRWIKVTLALARGKRQFDKREAERDRDVEREIREQMKSARR